MKENLKFTESSEYLAARGEFASYYESDILPVLQQAEKIRKRYAVTFWLMSVCILIWLGYVIFTIGQGFNPENDSGKGSGYYGLAGCLLTLLLCWPMLGYHRRNKENLLPLIAKFFGEFTYVYRPELPLPLLEKSLLFKKNEPMMADDCFNGTYKGLPTNIVEYITYNIRRQRDEENRTERMVYAKKGGGIIFYAGMNKNFTGQTLVVADKGWLNKLVRYKNLQRVGLESPEFEKAYEVYSDNQIEARYLLTAVMLEYMTELKKSFPKIEFSFFENHLLIKIETKKNMFECTSFFRSVINKPRVEKIFTELYLLFSVIETLRLNQQRML